MFAKSSKCFNLLNAPALGIDQIQRTFKPTFDQTERWQTTRSSVINTRRAIYNAFISPRAQE